MTPAVARSMYRRQMNRHGEDVVLARAAATVTVKGKLHQPLPDELIDVQDQTIQKVLVPAEPLEAAGWPVPPRKGDKVTIGGRDHFVESVDASRRVAGVQIAFDLTVVG